MAKKKLNKGSAGQNRVAGQDYMDKYRQKDGVQETDSGLLYRVLEQGDGIAPTETDTVEVNQRILTVAGKVIADTYKEGETNEFTMKEAIPGVREALMMMRENGRMEFVVPPELAWGKKGVGNKIGPNMTMVFDVRLLEVIFS